MPRVLLLFGGRSAEHEVSCTSAVAVHEALTSAAHQVIPVGISRDGVWHMADAGRSPFQAVGRPVTWEVPGGHLTAGADEIGFDVVFPVLHGPYGEDGTMQGLFEITGVPYVGCGVLASALAMDKDTAKRLFAAAGLPVARWEVVSADAFDTGPAAVVSGLVERLQLPAFVKPNALGSSVGVTKVTTEAELKEGIEIALAYGPRAIVEEAVRGREIEVGVLEGPRVSVPGEIVLEVEWYDYDAKYRDDTSRFVAPALLRQSQVAEVQALAARAFEVLGCRSMARVDFFLEEGARGFLLNEVNTIPGFTPISGFPKMWQASGMAYADLCDELVNIALGTT